MRTAQVAVILFLASAPASAHRLDEYLQGSIISVEKNLLQVQMTLTPGVAVLPFLLSSIDTDADGAISGTEQRAYAGQVLQDLSLTIDGHRLRPKLLAVHFPTIEGMKEGSGEIQLDFSADLPRGGRHRKLILENHHQSRISAYQVNALIPRDPGIRIATQDRNYSQSVYELNYVQNDLQNDAGSVPSPFPSRLDIGWLVVIALLLSARLMILWRRRTVS